MESAWSRLTPRFILYLLTLGLRLARYYVLTTLGLDRKSMEFRNIENNEQYNFTLPRRVDTDGVTALIRAKNEEDKILYCLASIYDVFSQIVIVDNGSEDRTCALVGEFKKRYDAGNKITMVSYPFVLARNGPEHAGTPEDSLHSIVYFSNYSLSHCRRKCICKWDADMVLREDAREIFAGFLAQLARGTRYRWAIYGQTVYRTIDGALLTSDDELARETRIFPASYYNRFVKHESFEVMYSPLYRKIFEPVVFYELKFASGDEFSHWSTTDFPTERKKREWTILSSLARGLPLDDKYEVLSAGSFAGVDKCRAIQ